MDQLAYRISHMPSRTVNLTFGDDFNPIHKMAMNFAWFVAGFTTLEGFVYMGVDDISMVY